MNARVLAIVQASAVVFAGSLAGVLAKRSLDEVHPFTFVWLQIGIGTLLLSLYTFCIRGERFPRGLSWSVWGYIFALGIGNFTVVRVLFMLSLERLPATTHVYLVNFVGIVTMLLSIFMLGERPSWRQFVGAVVGIVGLRVFFRALPTGPALDGVIMVAIGVVALAVANNIARQLGRVAADRVSTTVISTLALWIGGIPVVLYGIWTDCPPLVTGWENWGVIALNGLVGVAVGLTVWIHILRTLRSFEASILASMSVIFIALLAIPILGERLALHEIAGIGLMMLGVALVQLRRGPVSSGPAASGATDATRIG